MVEQWNRNGGKVEDLIMEQWSIRWRNSGTSECVTEMIIKVEYLIVEEWNL